MKKIIHKTPAMYQIEDTFGEEIEELLRRLFVDENLSHQDIASKLNISHVTVIKWLRLAGVRSRKLNVR